MTERGAGAKILLDRLDRVRRRERGVSVGAGLLKTVLAGLGLAAGFFVLDWLILSRAAEGAEADRLARGVLVLAMAGTLGWVFWKNVWRELVRELSDDEMALRVESRHPELRGRLISTIQLARAGEAGVYAGSEELIEALEEDTVSFSQAINFFDVINIATLKKVGIAALGFVLLASGLAAWRADYAKALLGRMLLARTAYPTATRILSVTPGGVVPRGESFRVEAELDPAGYVPESARLLARSAPGTEAAEYPLSRVEGAGASGGPLFRGSIERVMEDTSYTVVAYDARWIRWEPLRVLRRPAIKSLELGLDFPDYCGLADAVRNVGDVQALVGTKVRVTAHVSKPVTSARLGLRLGRRSAPTPGAWREGDAEVAEESEKLVPMELSADGTIAHGAFTIERDGYYRILLKDADGLENTNPVEYVIDAVEDRPPSVVITFPARDKTVTRFAKWPIRFEARDDFGVARGWLKCRNVSSVADTTGAAGEGDVVAFALTGLPKETGARQVRAETTLELERLNLDVGRRLVYWIEIEDNKAPSPNVGRSKEYEFTVATAEEVLSLIGAAREEALDRIEMLRKKELETKEGVESIKRGLSP